jgi:hypothetical protein
MEDNLFVHCKRMWRQHAQAHVTMVNAHTRACTSDHTGNAAMQ